jgi:hypothetical protein
VTPHDRADLPGCRRGRPPREERLADREAARVREHAEAAARLKRKYG